MKSKVRMFSLISIVCFAAVFASGATLPGGSPSAAKAFAFDPYYARLTGTIGGKAAVTFNLVFDGKQVRGYYRYDRVGQPIELRGELSGESFEIEEFGGANGEPSGLLSGKVSAKGGALAMTGTWCPPDRAKTLAFAVVEDWTNAVRFDAFKRFETRLLDEADEDGPFAEYSNERVCPRAGSPHRKAFLERYFGGAEPAEHFGYDSEAYFEDYADENLDMWKESEADMAPVYSWSRYSIVTPMINGPRYVVLGVDGYEFTGGAHGMSYGGYDTYDAKEQRFLSYKDFWKPGSEDELSKLLTAAFRVQRGIAPGAPLEEEGCFVDALPFGEETQFFVCKAGLVALYQSYEILPYAEGLPLVFVPFKDIEPYLLPGRKVFE